MINLNECKFGDKLRTKDGRMAVFLHKSITHNVYICIIEHNNHSHLKMKFRENGKRYYDNEPSAFDIVSKWKE